MRAESGCSKCSQSEAIHFESCLGGGFRPWCISAGRRSARSCVCAALRRVAVRREADARTVVIACAAVTPFSTAALPTYQTRDTISSVMLYTILQRRSTCFRFPSGRESWCVSHRQLCPHFFVRNSDTERTTRFNAGFSFSNPSTARVMRRLSISRKEDRRGLGTTTARLFTAATRLRAPGASGSDPPRTGSCKWSITVPDMHRPPALRHRNCLP